MKHTLTALLVLCSMSGMSQTARIDRQAVLKRHNPMVTVPDSLGSLTVGNGRFAATVDVTGLQSFPGFYRNGIPLTTMAEWGWHAFPNGLALKEEETLGTVDLGHGHAEIYAVEYKQTGRQKEATDYFRINPHRLNLGTVGLSLRSRSGRTIAIDDLADIRQTLSLGEGVVRSNYKVEGEAVGVVTCCDQHRDAISATIDTRLLGNGRAAVTLSLPYPTGRHADDAADWVSVERHQSDIIQESRRMAVIRHIIDSTTYYIKVQWEGRAALRKTATHKYELTTNNDKLAFCVEYSEERPTVTEDFCFQRTLHDNGTAWNDYWQNGGFVDFGHCTDPRAKELERRVVLSLYLTAVNCRGSIPPQETGLTYNSWFGRPHLEMAWWHLVHFSLWNKSGVMERMLDWYNRSAYPMALKIAQRQGFRGARWMKMTDPWAGEAPSNTGSFLLWQQPHYIYLAEETYRAHPTAQTLEKYAVQVEQTAEFMADFAQSCSRGDTIRLFGATAMQESMSKDFSFAHPFEQAYWVYGLRKAQEWRERTGKTRRTDWDDIIRRIAPLDIDADGRYASGLPLHPFVETGETELFDPFKTPGQRGRKAITAGEFALKSRSDHPAVLGACGMLPDLGIYDVGTMQQTQRWVTDNWNWPTTWGWDYGMMAMAAARLGDGAAAVDALLTDKGKNTYLSNGHNFQEPRRLRLYLPGNGALLTAIAMMCAGWDGATYMQNPGFPHNGQWDVRWEGLRKMQ